MVSPQRPKATSAAQSVQRRIVRGYSLALLLIAGAVTGTFLTLKAVISQQSQSAWLVNISGRQRMLSQRISLQAIQLVQSDTESTRRRLGEEIARDMQTFRASHKSLIEASGGVAGMSEALRLLYYDGGGAVDTAVHRYERDVENLLALPDGERKIAAANRLAETAKGKLLEQLNAVVSQYQSEAEERIHSLERIELSIYLITLLGLALEVLLIFRPMVREIGARTCDLEEMTYRASHDELTGLANRRHFYEHATATLAVSLEANKNTGVLHIDLDGFKTINDRHGHAAGDAVLRDVAARLRDAARGGDMAARLGGDEFVILVSDVQGAEDLESMAARLLAQFYEPVQIDGGTVRIGASIGVALVPPGKRSIQSVLHESDQALYKAKAKGKGTWRWLVAPTARMLRRA